jgi:hypothetical protein
MLFPSHVNAGIMTLMQSLEHSLLFCACWLLRVTNLLRTATLYCEIMVLSHVPELDIAAKLRETRWVMLVVAL